MVSWRRSKRFTARWRHVSPSRSRPKAWSEPERMPFDLLFRNARIVDGTGNPWYRADLAVANGRVAAIGHELDGPAAREIDVADKIVAPGFVDMHAHSDAMLLAEPRHEPKIFQGVTTD